MLKEEKAQQVALNKRRKQEAKLMKAAEKAAAKKSRRGATQFKENTSNIGQISEGNANFIVEL